MTPPFFVPGPTRRSFDSNRRPKPGQRSSLGLSGVVHILLLLLVLPSVEASAQLAEHFDLTIGQVVTNGVPAPGAGTIETPGASDVFTFNATAGESVYFDALTGNPCDPRLRWKCVGPTNQVVFDRALAGSPGCGNGDPGTVSFQASGTYTLTVYGAVDPTGTYAFSVVPIVDQSFALTLGQAVTNGIPGAGAGILETPGALDTYTFQATAGQSVYFDALTGNPCDPRLRWKCVGPTNQVLFDQWLTATPGCGNGDPGTVTLQASGTYTVTVYGAADSTGAYGINIVPVLAQPFALTLGQAVTNNVPSPGAGILETPGALDSYTFQATTGQSVYFDALTGNPCDPRLRWKCVGPTNQVLFDQWLTATPGCGNGDPGTMTFPASGTYTVTVYGFTDATGNYAFQVMPVLPQTFTLALGQIVTNGVPGTGAGSIETPGASDVFPFSATAGQSVYFDALTGNPCDPRLRWKCVGPTNQVLFDQWLTATPGCGNGDPGTMTFPVSGTYTVTVSGFTDATGNYAFQVMPVLPQTFTLALGQIVTNGVPGIGAGSIETSGASDVFTFSATAGQSVYFDALTGNPCDPRLRWKCIGPTNLVLFDQWLTATPGCGNGDPGTITFPASGTYTVTVYGGTDATGTYAFNVVPILSQSFSVNRDQVVTNGVPGPGAGVIETAGAFDSYSFVASAGQSVYFDALTGNPCDPRLRWKCIGPTNQVLFDQWFVATPGCGNSDPGNHTFAEAGLYSIVVYGGLDGTGIYSFQLIEPSPIITREPADQYVVAGRTAVFTVVGSSESPVRYQWLFNGFNLPGQTNATLTLPQLATTQSGAYSVRLENAAGSVSSRPAILTVSAWILQTVASRTDLPAVHGNGVTIDLFNGIGGGVAPRPETVADRVPDGTTLSPVIDFPSPGSIVNVGTRFDAFFAATATPPDQVRGLNAGNFTLQSRFFLRVSRDLDREPATPEIDIALGVGSDDGFHLTVGTNFLGQAGDRGFLYSWMPLAFEGEGLYPVTLLFAANATGQSGLEFAWNTATSNGDVIVPQEALYLSPNIGDRLVTFEEVPVGTVLSNQFAGQGVLFRTLGGQPQVTDTTPDRLVPVSPRQVFADPNPNPATTTEVELRFVVPGTSTPAVTEFVGFFVLDTEQIGATVTAFDTAGDVLFTNTYHGGGASQEAVSIAAPRIARVLLTLGQGADTAGLDNLSFTTPVSGADLIAGAVSAPILAAPGTSIAIAWGVTNVGITPAQGPWTEQIFVIPSAPGGGNPVLAEFRMEGSLPPGGSLVHTQTVVFTPDGPAGLLRIGVRLDADNDLPELNERNNTTVTTNTVDVPPTLTLEIAAHETTEGAPPIRGAVIRNGDRNSPLSITLTNSNTNALTHAATLVIPIGQHSAAFDLHPPLDGVVDGSQLATVTASAEGFVGASETFTIEDSDVPRLSLQLTNATVREGAVAQAVIHRELASADPLTVFLSASLPDFLEVPASVTIPAQATSATVQLLALENSEVGRPRIASIVAYAVRNQDSSPVTLTITDNDLPGLSFTLADSEVNESDGPQATVATVTRTPASPTVLMLEVQSSQPQLIRVPAIVQLTAGQTSVTFPIAVVDDASTNSTRVVELTLYPIDPATRERLAPGTTAQLAVTDDEGPTLQVVLARRLVAEGWNPATSGTITRTGNLTSSTSVTLRSSDPGEAEVPATVTFAAGQSKADFQVRSLDDGIRDANQVVRITASATGYASGSDVLVVSELELPDLLVQNLSVPTTGETEAPVNVSFRIANQGLASASTNVVTRVYLSSDPVVGDDTLLGQLDFTGTLPPEQAFEQTLQVRLPVTSGDYWLVVVTDAEDRVQESLEDNNVTVGSLPIRVREAYTATVTATPSQSLVGAPVLLRGQAVRAGSTVAAPHVPVHVHVVVRDSRRVLLGLTDVDGNFSVTFQPLPNEAGRYEVAAAHPGAGNPPVQDRFTILGFRAVPPTEPVPLVEQVAKVMEIPLENLSDVPLAGLQAQVIRTPTDVSAAVSILGDGILGAWGDATLRVALTAGSGSPPQGQVQIRVTSAEGAATDVAWSIERLSQQPRLLVTPVELVAGMKRGGQALVELSIVNGGGSPSGPISVLTPELPWLHVATTTPLASLAGGETNRVTLQLTPAADLPLGEYTGALMLQAGALQVPVPFRFRSLAEAHGALRITAEDEYTYYAEGSPHVTNALVTVRDAVSGDVLAEGTTDGAGQALFEGILEGYYDVEVRADQHISYRNTALVRAGITEEIRAFLSRETVRYLWTVEPTEIEERTRISIETVFETFVPIPVVTIEPNVIDLADITADVTQVDMRISNHGLIAANELRLGFSAHPEWDIQPLVSELGALPARSSIVIPVTIRRLQAPAVATHGRRPGLQPHAGGPCGITGGAVWTLICGTKQSYSSPVHVLNVGGDCSGGGGSWGGTGSVGGPFVSAPFFPIKIDCNTNQPPCKPLNLPEVNLSALLKPLAKAFDGLANFYLERNIWTRVLGLSVETEPEAKGKIGLCCTNDVPVEEITANLSGKVKLKVGDSYKTKISESFPGFQVANNLKGQLELNGDLTFGIQAEPSFKVSGTYKAGCGRDKPEVSVTITGGVAIQGGAFGKAKASLKALDAPIHFDESFVNGGIKGSLEFSWTYNSEGESKFCYKTEGLYVQANAKLFGFEVDMFYPTNKHFLIPSAEICDPPAALLATLGLDQLLEETRQRVQAAVRDASPPRAALHQPASSDEGGGVCAQVRLKLDQDLILTRNAFQATLEIDNGDATSPIEDLSVQIGILSSTGRGAEDRFEIRTNRLEAITHVDGTGTLLPSTRGTVSWVLVPLSNAAPEEPVVYQVSGLLSYRQAGRTLRIPLASVPITVQPDPRLHVRYFHQRDVFSDDPFTAIVEPSVPYSLAVMIQNTGKGTARNVQITSAQPRIVENEKGLLIDFKIVGTEVAGRQATPSLTAEFGEIPPGEISIGRWLLTSTLQGLFVDYQASIEHQAGEQERRRSLVDEVSIHEMIRLVQAQAGAEDGKPDFLVNDVPDAEDLPDFLYLSNGTTERVDVRREASITGILDANTSSVSLSMGASAGWTYLRIPDPGRGAFQLVRVTRSDGQVIAAGTNAWTTDRTFVGNGRKPRREHLLHLLDHSGPGLYTLVYSPLAPAETEPPSSRVDPLPANSFALIPVNWSGSDNPGGSGLAAFDIFVSVNGGPFEPWLQQTPQHGAVYTGVLGNRYAFYSVATDNLGNREPIPSTAETETTVTRENHPPTLAAIPDQQLDQGDVLIVEPVAVDPDDDLLAWSFVGTAPVGAQIHPQTGLITWVTGEGLVPGTTSLTVQVLDNGLPRLGTTRTFRVRIDDRNAPPTLAPLGDRVIDEGRVLELVALATDSDIPRQRLTFRFEGPVPAGATLHPETGVFSWRPNEAQGGTTNRLSIVVTDDGAPPLSATQAFLVIVRDTRSDFVLQIGRTNVPSGGTRSVPIRLRSQAGLTHLAFVLELPGGRLSQLAVEPLVSELASASSSPAGDQRFRIQLAAAPGQVLPGGTDLARLRFSADRLPGSAVLPLRVLDVDAVGSGGEILRNSTAIDGKVFLVETEPLLDAGIAADGQREVAVYGLPGRAYELQFKTNVLDGTSWVPLTTTVVEGEGPARITFTIDSPSLFFRALERDPSTPTLRLLGHGTGSWSLQLEGRVGRTYRVESETHLTGKAWQEIGRVTLTQPTHRFDLTPHPTGHQFFRAVAE
jgi:hypothetical protein